jgi:acyl dehydratase
MSRINFERFFKTEKQKEFSTDFFMDAEDYEIWNEIDFSNLQEVDGEKTFKIKAEDIQAYAAGCLDDNPFMTDEKYAKKSPYGGLIAHPLFVTPIIFYCVGKKGRGNWIRTPGARNPGQEIEIYDHFRVGEEVHIKLRPYDRYIKRGKYYLRYKIDIYNQDNVKKATCISTLILPPTREDMRKFLKGQRGLTD